MPVLCIRSTNVSSCALVAYVRFRLILNPEGLLHRHRGQLLEFQCGDGNCPSRFRTPAGQAGQLRKNGAVGLSVRRSESVLLRNDFYARVVTGMQAQADGSIELRPLSYGRSGRADASEPLSRNKRSAGCKPMKPGNEFRNEPDEVY
jgi:hypothetical protein